MTKFIHHGTFDSAQMSLNVTTFKDSDMELEVGAAHDMSKQQIVLLERGECALRTQIDALRLSIDQLRDSLPATAARDTLCEKAAEIAGKAARAMTDRKWYSISAAGLLEAAKAVGEAASPLVKAAFNVV